MKNKFYFLLFFTVWAVNAAAQDTTPDSLRMQIDWKEDSTDITTIADIINTQHSVNELNSRGSHFADVWGRRSYFNISRNTTKLSSKEDIPTGVPSLNGGLFSSQKSDWGVSMQYGRSYRLHKKPIANVAQIYLDFTSVDFNINHFKAARKDSLYDSRETTIQDEKEISFLPWNNEKYEANFGMNIGPSVTFAPFTYLDIPELHYIKLNIFYHIGYHASGIALMKADEKKGDISQESDVDFNDNQHERYKSEQFLWGHGVTNSIGFSISWKTIGIGYEHRTAKVKYKAVNTEDFGTLKYKFNNSTNRLYIQLRW